MTGVLTCLIGAAKTKTVPASKGVIGLTVSDSDIFYIKQSHFYFQLLFHHMLLAFL